MSLASNMLVLVLTLSALAARARADCDACVAGLCHSRRPISLGFSITDQLAIDRTNNVLYMQLNNVVNLAIFLDDLQSHLVNMMPTSGMAVNQKTQRLYLGTQVVNNTYFMYNLPDNKTEAVGIRDYAVRPRLMFYGANHLYFISSSHSKLYYYNMTARQVYLSPNLNDISDFVIGEDQNLFFVSNGTVYIYKLNDAKPAQVIMKNNHVALSVDKHDNVYLADAAEKVIYKHDQMTDKKYAAYTSDAIEDFVFDKDNRIVFRDAHGVSQWVPDPAHMRCAFDPQGGFFMKVV